MSITKTGLTYTFAAVFNDIPLSGLQDIPTNTVIGRETPGTGPPQSVAVSGGIGFSGAGTIELTANQRIRALPVWVYQNGAVLTTGIKADLMAPFSCTITKVTLLADQNGNVVVDIWKDTFANYPPTVADTITGGAKPTLSGANKYQDGVLTGWNTTINAGDILRFNFDSASVITRLAIGLDVRTV
jgi:hypothetical protein